MSPALKTKNGMDWRDRIRSGDFLGAAKQWFVYIFLIIRCVSTLPTSQFPYPMFFASIQTLIFCFVSWITLKLFRRILAGSSLDTLPSPPPTSLVFGESIHHFSSIHLTVLGNIPELYHPEGWDFHRKILESCKYQFGESYFFSRWLNRWNHYENQRRFRSMMPFIVQIGNWSNAKERLLLTSDPKALYHILVKVQCHPSQHTIILHCILGSMDLRTINIVDKVSNSWTCDKWLDAFLQGVTTLILERAFSQLWVRYSSNWTSNASPIVTITGQQHRKQRKMLNPVFSINHMRDMSTCK